MQTLEQYIDVTQSCLTEDALFAAFDKILRPYGVEFWAYHLLSTQLHAIPFESGAIRQNFPSAYVRHYNQGDLVDVDPVILACRMEAKPFHWRDAGTKISLTPQQAQFLELVEQSPLTDGLAIPLFGPLNSMAYFSLATTQTGGFQLTARQISELQFICLQTHNRYLDLFGEETAKPQLTLSPREREVLTEVASGHSNARIAEKLGITENTVDTMLRRVFAKLGVNNRITAVLRGIGSGLILPVAENC